MRSITTIQPLVDVLVEREEGEGKNKQTLPAAEEPWTWRRDYMYGPKSVCRLSDMSTNIRAAVQCRAVLEQEMA